MKNLIITLAVIGLITSLSFAQQKKVMVVSHTHYLEESDLESSLSFVNMVGKLPNYFQDSAVENRISQYTELLIKERLQASELVYLDSSKITVNDGGWGLGILKKPLKAASKEEGDLFISIASTITNYTGTGYCCDGLLMKFRVVNKRNKRVDKETVLQRVIPLFDSTLTGDVLMGKEDFIRLYERSLYAMFMEPEILRKPVEVTREIDPEYAPIVDSSERFFLLENDSDWDESSVYELVDQNQNTVDSIVFNIGNSDFGRGGFWDNDIKRNTSKVKIKGSIYSLSNGDGIPIYMRLKSSTLFNKIDVRGRPKIEIPDRGSFYFGDTYMSGMIDSVKYFVTFKRQSSIIRLLKENYVMAVIQPGSPLDPQPMYKVYFIKNRDKNERTMALSLFLAFKRFREMKESSEALEDAD